MEIPDYGIIQFDSQFSGCRRWLHPPTPQRLRLIVTWFWNINFVHLEELHFINALPLCILVCFILSRICLCCASQPFLRPSNELRRATSCPRLCVFSCFQSNGSLNRLHGVDNYHILWQYIYIYISFSNLNGRNSAQQEMLSALEPELRCDPYAFPETQGIRCLNHFGKKSEIFCFVLLWPWSTWVLGIWAVWAQDFEDAPDEFEVRHDFYSWFFFKANHGLGCACGSKQGELRSRETRIWGHFGISLVGRSWVCYTCHCSLESQQCFWCGFLSCNESWCFLEEAEDQLKSLVCPEIYRIRRGWDALIGLCIAFAELWRFAMACRSCVLRHAFGRLRRRSACAVQMRSISAEIWASTIRPQWELCIWQVDASSFGLPFWLLMPYFHRDRMCMQVLWLSALDTSAC